jgi:hypothetical protein
MRVAGLFFKKIVRVLTTTARREAKATATFQAMALWRRKDGQLCPCMVSTMTTFIAFSAGAVVPMLVLEFQSVYEHE